MVSSERVQSLPPLEKYVFNWREGGWAGASEGRVLSNFFTNWGGSNLFHSQPGEGNSFFWQGKNYSMSASILYIQAKLPVETKLNYFTGVEKFTYQNIIFSQLT